MVAWQFEAADVQGILQFIDVDVTVTISVNLKTRGREKGNVGGGGEVIMYKQSEYEFIGKSLLLFNSIQFYSILLICKDCAIKDGIYTLWGVTEKRVRNVSKQKNFF